MEEEEEEEEEAEGVAMGEVVATVVEGDQDGLTSNNIDMVFLSTKCSQWRFCLLYSYNQLPME